MSTVAPGIRLAISSTIDGPSTLSDTVDHADERTHLVRLQLPDEVHGDAGGAPPRRLDEQLLGVVLPDRCTRRLPPPRTASMPKLLVTASSSTPGPSRSRSATIRAATRSRSTGLISGLTHGRGLDPVGPVVRYRPVGGPRGGSPWSAAQASLLAAAETGRGAAAP